MRNMTFADKDIGVFIAKPYDLNYLIYEGEVTAHLTNCNT
jgi:hypothetical protein